MSNAYNSASLLVTPNGYKASKIYSAKPTDGTGDLAFSRASTAMRRNSAGLWESVANNVPRLQYPVGGGCPSWLFEPQATNSFLNSNTPSDYVLTNVTASGNLFTEDTANSTHQIRTPFYNFDTSVTRTYSVRVKRNSLINRLIYLSVSDGSTGNVNSQLFNLTTGATTGSSSVGGGWTFVSNKITADGADYWLIELTGYTAVNSNQASMNVRLYDTLTSSDNYLGTGQSFYAQYNQTELGSVATSPIITAGSAVTRLADVSRTAGLSSLIGQTEGTLFVEFDSFKNVGVITQGILFVITGANYIGIYKFGSNIVFEIVSGGAVLLSQAIAYADGKVAITYNTNSFSAFFNGAKVGLTATIGVPPTVSSIDVGSFSTGGSANGNIKTFELYKTQISDSEAIELTQIV